MKIKQINSILRRAAADNSLNATDLRVIMFFAGGGSQVVNAKQRDIGEALGIARAQISRSMTALQELGYLLRVRNGVYSLVGDNDEEHNHQ